PRAYYDLQLHFRKNLVRFSSGPHPVWYERYLGQNLGGFVVTLNIVEYAPDYLAHLTKSSEKELWMLTLTNTTRDYAVSKDEEIPQRITKWRADIKQARGDLLTHLKDTGLTDLNYRFPPIEFEINDQRTKKTPKD